MPGSPGYSSVACGIWALELEDWRHHARLAACKLQIAKRGWRPAILKSASMHVPTVFHSATWQRLQEPSL